MKNKHCRSLIVDKQWWVLHEFTEGSFIIHFLPGFWFLWFTNLIYNSIFFWITPCFLKQKCCESLCRYFVCHIGFSMTTMLVQSFERYFILWPLSSLMLCCLRWYLLANHQFEVMHIIILICSSTEQFSCSYYEDNLEGAILSPLVYTMFAPSFPVFDHFFPFSSFLTPIPLLSTSCQIIICLIIDQLTVIWPTHLV